VTAVTVANGGDNIGIYIPLFASTGLTGFGVTIGVFYLMVGVWCLFAYWLTRHRKIAALLEKYGEKITPWVLIMLGIHILLDGESYRLLGIFP
jgi:cadmium resistance protein CadD (predicted permease)